jgi:YjjG family noncanonical pyrimidine nucleotidase
MPYKCIFFDLDHTLWDYETNSRETLQELYEKHTLHEKGVTDFKSFHSEFSRVNVALWELYDHGKIGSEVIRKERFKQILATFQLHDETLNRELSDEYLHVCPKKGNLMPNAIETLQYLEGKYKLSIITNGFEEIQNIKLSAANLHTYFDHIVTSQKAGHKKPALEIFDYTLKLNSVSSHEAIMVGDNLITDIGGARTASIATVFFNPDKIKHEEKVSIEINNLGELCDHL